uniref:Uncharacterized protein n=8 Tax=Aegilops tauschii subsp. strangulata TaxID=200361 RepID=A0A453LKN9_AEGTS
MDNTEDQVVGVSASLSTANRNQSCVSTSAGTPERTANRGYHLDHESSMDRSVNSQYQKRRRFNIPVSCCTGAEHSNPSLNPSNPSSTSFCNTDCAVSMAPGDLKRTDRLCCESLKMSRSENFKLERSHKAAEFASNKSAGTKLDIRCTTCKTPLGLQKDGFLVSCSLASPSKLYLTCLLRHGLSTVGFAEDLMSSPPAVVNVLVCDASSLNQGILSKFCSEGSAHQSGVWSEKDGCVYKPVTCPFCPRENSFATVLGAQVLAADASNLESLNKVLLFADCLDLKHEPSNEQVARDHTVASNLMGTDASKPMSPPPVIDLESFAYKPVKKEPVSLSTRRSKLRLPSTDRSTKPQLVHNVEDS